MKKKLIVGGVGDILLSVDKGRKCIMGVDLWSHFPHAKELVEMLGITVNHFEYYKTPPPPIPGEIVEKVTMPEWVETFKDFHILDAPAQKKLIGIHPFGSQLSQDVWGKEGWPAKRISNEAILHIIESLQHKYDFLIFGSQKEIDSLPVEIYTHHSVYKTTMYTNMFESLGMVTWCDAMIATDSVMKTMSAICKIPTYVFMGNYVDTYRDAFFIDPYISNGTMKVWQFVRCTPELFDPAINELLLR